MSIRLVNSVAVSLFGIILSAAFCDIRWTQKKKLLMGISAVALILLQGSLVLILEPPLSWRLYPLVMHVPLLIVLYFFNKSWLWSGVAILTAYNCCVLRRWLAFLIVTVGGGHFMTNAGAEVLITIPLLLAIVYAIAPAVRTFSRYTVSIQLQFALIPALSYFFYYLIRIYTDWFERGTPIVVEFMSFVCSGAYLVFALRVSKEERQRSQMERTQGEMNLQLEQAIREIEFLRESQEQVRVYRHDLRHHMQYLSSCIEKGNLIQAQTYINEICSEIEENKIVTYCENEAANLIFSAYAGRAEARAISFTVSANIPSAIHISEKDLCVILSNALENALHACEKLQEKGNTGVMEVNAYQKGKKLFFQFINSCDDNISFVDGVPVTTQPGHGIGVNSICTLVEKYEGIYNFMTQNGKFILRISL